MYHKVDTLPSLQEPQIKCGEHQDNSYVDSQPCPEVVSEKCQIYSDYDGDHRDNADRIDPHGIFFHTFQCTTFFLWELQSITRLEPLAVNLDEV